MQAVVGGGGGGGGGRCERHQSLLNLELERVDVNGKLVVTIKFWAVELFVHCILFAQLILQ